MIFLTNSICLIIKLFSSILNIINKSTKYIEKLFIKLTIIIIIQTPYMLAGNNIQQAAASNCCWKRQQFPTHFRILMWHENKFVIVVAAASIIQIVVVWINKNK